MVGLHHQLNGHEFEQLQEIVKDREAWSAAVKELYMTEQLYWNDEGYTQQSR